MEHIVLYIYNLLANGQMDVKTVHYSTEECSKRFPSFHCPVLPFFIPESFSWNGSRAHMAISAFLPRLPWCSLGGNFSILLMVRTEFNLHKPMCSFLSMLSWLTWPSLQLPCLTSLSNFWFHDREIYLELSWYKSLLLTHSAALPQGLSWSWPWTAMWLSAIS